MYNIWNNFFYEPLYNGLIFLISVIPGGNVAIAIILLTIIVKLILYPLSQKSITTQAKMKSLEGEISSIKNKHKENKEAVARETMELYKKHSVNPFSGCLTIIIQLPIIIALYFVFFKGLTPEDGVIYSFVHFPENINTFFLGFIDVTKKSIVLAIFAGITQYIQTDLSLPKSSPVSSGKISFADEFSRSMNMQMRYFLPVLIIFVAYTTSAAVSLYFITSSLFMIGQEYLVKKKTNTLLLETKS